MWLLLVLSLSSVQKSYQTELFSVQHGSDYSVEAVCSKDKGELCQLVDFKLENLIEIMSKKEKEFTLPKSVEKKGMVFKLKTEERTAKNYFFAVFETEDGSEAEFTVNPKSMSITGVMRILNNEGTFDTYIVTFCGENCHKLQKITDEIETFEQDDVIDPLETIDGSDYGISMKDFETIKAGFAKPDNKTVAEPTITFYLTPEFLEEYKDPYGFVSLLVSQINERYKSNQIPIKLKLHCIKKAPFRESDRKWLDGESSDHRGGKKFRLWTFSNLGNKETKMNNLRLSADMVCLLVSDNYPKTNNGEAVNGLQNGYNLCYVHAQPALKGMTLDHEIAHMYGCAHGIPGRTDNNKYMKYGIGYQVPGGFRTILARSDSAHKIRIPYYSSPDLMGKTPSGKSLKLGEPGKHDNRRVLIERRFQMTEYGDESIKCSSDLMTPSKNGGEKGIAAYIRDSRPKWTGKEKKTNSHTAY